VRTTYAVGSSYWTILTAAGLGLGLLGGLLVGIPLGPLVNAMIVTGAVTGTVGAVLGGMQAIALRPLRVKAVWWILATMAGLGVGLAAGVVTVEQAGILITGKRPNVARLDVGTQALSFVVVGLVAGMLLGAVQSLAFRKRVPHIENWILTTGVGLAVAFASASLLLGLARLSIASVLGFTIFVLISGCAFGAITSRPLRVTA
jgi:hypothetical protein